MKLTVLGFQSPFSGYGGATPGYLVEVEGKRILFDCGSGVLANLANIIKPYELDAVFLSHLHHDHISDFFILQYAMLVAKTQKWRTTPLKVWAPTEPKSWYEKLRYHQLIQLTPMEEGKDVSIDGVRLSFFRTDHAIPCYAMKLSCQNKTILYGADSGPKTNWKRMASQPDLFICEASFLHKDLPAKTGHLSAKLAAASAKQIGAKRLLLTHLYPDYNLSMIKQEAEQVYHEEILMPRIGLEIQI
jgi:ribonuclease BN (tRNA processing enzyme)